MFPRWPIFRSRLRLILQSSYISGREITPTMLLPLYRSSIFRALLPFISRVRLGVLAAALQRTNIKLH